NSGVALLECAPLRFLLTWNVNKNQLLRSEHCLSTDQGRLSTGEDHLSTDGSYLSAATGGFALSGFWK
ncbi:hypothetical protein Taro_020622, partial [Colocasia esculenta]|nr:hypothetical protein [Colocasia esculenta]